MTSEGLTMTDEGLRMTSEGLRMTSEGLRMTSEGLRMTSEELRMITCASGHIAKAAEPQAGRAELLSNPCGIAPAACDVAATRRLPPQKWKPISAVNARGVT